MASAEGSNDSTGSVDRGNLIGLTQDQLLALIERLGERPFHAQQMMKWIYQRGVSRFEEMTDLSKKLRVELGKLVDIRLPEEVVRSESKDGTIKWVLSTENGNAIETVLIPDRGRNTLCISSQIGCMLDCRFCATGKQGFNGNLDRGEIVGQVLHVERYLQSVGDTRGVTNVVFMGMGEPLLNFEEVMAAADVFTDDVAFGLSKRRVTVSTAGVVPGIQAMCGRTDVALAVSLHAPDDATRSKLVPINKKYPIADLIDACRQYLATLGERRSVTVEYTLIEGMNDSTDDARALARLLRPLKCKVNLIPFNPFPASGFERPAESRIRSFQTVLLKAGYATMLRTTRGDDIDAACGQLKGRVQDRTRRQSRYIARINASSQTELAASENDAQSQRLTPGEVA